MPASLRTCLALSCLASWAAAQVLPGRSVCTVAVANVPAIGEMYVVDHQTNVATLLTLSAALTAERVNCVLMTNPVGGYVGTNPPSLAPGNVYRITILGGVVTETVVNTTPTQGPNVAQIVQVGSTLYFTTQNATNTVGSGFLQSVPVAGGAVTVISDLSALSGYIGGSGGANAVAAVGTKVFVATFDATTSATATGCLIVHDTIANTTAVALTLPPGKTPSGTTAFVNTAIVHMHVIGGMVHLLGIYGDRLIVDPTTVTLVRHEYAGAVNGTTLASALLNSFDVDPSTGDLICGTRDGRVHRIASSQLAQGVIPGVGSHATPGNNSVNGTSHVPAGIAATDTSYGAGCAGGSGFTLTDVSSGLPSAGNTGFKLGAYSGSGADLAAVLLAPVPQVPPLDLTVLNMPGCFLHLAGIVVSIGATLGGTGNGAGFVRIPTPIPASASGVTLYRQWAEIQAVPTNGLGVVVSNARKMDIR